MHLFYTPDLILSQLTYTLNEDESKHCVRVLRLSNNDELILVNGKGIIAKAMIIDNHPKKCTVKITEVTEHLNDNLYLDIAIAPTKNIERTEWFVEKATEIGINNIIFIETKNSERAIIKAERLEKVAVSAIKQSLKAYLPQLQNITTFKNFINYSKEFNGQKFIAHCINTNNKEHLATLYNKKSKVLILIGPEGDFTSDEVKLALDNGFKEINLGKSRLRTETAALYACVAINSINEL